MNPARARQGQVTIWIILGILMLAAMVATSYFVTIYIINPTSTGQTQLQDYVESCTNRIAERAVIALGERGGYIDATDTKYTDTTLTISTYPAEGDALFLDGEIVLPYWWYLSTPNDCANCEVTRGHIPSEADLERQIETYIEQNLHYCTDGFGVFADQGYIVQSGKVESTVELTEQDVLVRTNWPLTIETPRGSTVHMDEFATTLDVPLLSMWRAGQDIIEQTIEEQTMEHIILHLISSFSGSEFGKLPPTAAVTHGAGIVTWQERLVKQTLQEVLATYFPLIQLQQAKDAQHIRVGEGPEQGVYDALYVSLLDYAIPYNVDYSYLDWPIYFDISPNNEGRLVPEIDRTRFPADVASPFQTNYYEFFYDLSVPYLITLTSPTSLKGKGYTFTIAAEANIRDNKNLQDWHNGEGTVGPWNDKRFTLLEQIETVQHGECTCRVNGVPSDSVEKCFDTTNTCSITGNSYENYTACASDCTQRVMGDINEVEDKQDLFCDDVFATSGLTNVFVTDAVSGQILENAEVHYGCGSLATCSIGVTDRRGLVKDQLPFCFNGYLKTYLDGYYTDTQLHTPTDERTVLDVELVPLTTIQASIDVLDMYNISNREQLRPSALSPTENVVISIEKNLEETYQTPFVKFLTLDAGRSSPIDLIPGNYTIRAQLIDEAGYFLPRACKVINIPDSAPQIIPDKDLVVRPGIRGGVELTPQTGTVMITQDMLSNSTSLKIKVIRQPAPTCIEAEGCVLPNCVGLEELDRTDEFSLLHRKQLEPEFS